MDSHAISTLTASIDSFPTLPIVVSQVMEITADPESSVEDLMDVVSSDQSLTATLLKMANSAFFGLVREVSSLEKAVMVLGFAEIRNIILAKAVFNSFKNIKETSEFDIGKHWEHSFVCGLASKMIATKLRQTDGEFFVAGLLHDIGKLIIYMALPAELSMVMEMTGPSKSMMFQAEEKTFGMSHDEVGMRLLRKWFFPETLLTAVGFHHRPNEGREYSLFSKVVYAADHLTYMSEFPHNEDADQYMNRESIYAEIIDMFQSTGVKWDESDLDGFLKELIDRRGEASGTLSLFLQ